MNAKPRLVVLDLGGVVIDVDMNRALTALHARSKLDKLPRDFFSKAFFHQFEKGQITPDDFFQQARKEFQLLCDSTEFFDHWKSCIIGELPHVEAALRELKTHTLLFALSNTDRVHIEEVAAAFPVMRHFEKVFTSYACGYRKPESEIFELTWKEISKQTPGIDRRETLYVDDRSENVLAAKKFGWHSVLCEEKKALLKILQEQGLTSQKQNY